MDAVNVIKGYNKVNYHHDSQSPPPQKRLKATLALSAVLLLTLVLGLLLAAFVVRHSKSEQPDSVVSAPKSNPAESIKTVCGITRYPDSCFTSISSLNASMEPDPEIIFKLSLQATVAEVSNVSSLLKRLNDVHAEAALGDCVVQLGDALSRLNDSLSEMEVGPLEQMLTERKVNDMRTWISAGMTDEDSCLDGLEEMGSTVVDEVKSKIQKSKELMSNSLAIISNIHTLLEKFGFGLSMH